MDPDLENVIRQALGVAKAADRVHPSHAVELHTLIEEPEDMNTSDRGLKHVCPECATKYYDLKEDFAANTLKAHEPRGDANGSCQSGTLPTLSSTFRQPLSVSD